MTQLNELKILNDSNILYLKKLNKNYKRNEIIKSILDDETCFFKMNKDDAVIILKDLGILDDQIDTTYQKLISADEFYRLLNCNKIDLNDNSILIKYPIHNADDLFKNNNNDDELSQKNLAVIPHKKSFIQKILEIIKRIFKF